MVSRFLPCRVAISMLADLKLLSERVGSGTIAMNGLDGYTLHTSTNVSNSASQYIPRAVRARPRVI